MLTLDVGSIDCAMLVLAAKKQAAPPLDVRRLCWYVNPTGYRFGEQATQASGRVSVNAFAMSLLISGMLKPGVVIAAGTGRGHDRFVAP